MARQFARASLSDQQWLARANKAPLSIKNRIGGCRAVNLARVRIDPNNQNIFYSHLVPRLNKGMKGEKGFGDAQRGCMRNGEAEEERQVLRWVTVTCLPFVVAVV